jgi:ketosteroid isomerase-like protein
MWRKNVALARRGYEAVLRGDLDELEQLLDPNVTWHWWKRGPWDCQNRDEALAVIRGRIAQGAIGELREVSDIDDHRVLVVTKWPPGRAQEVGLEPGQEEIAHVVTIREGKVEAMHDYRSKAEALEAAGIG